MGPWVHGSMGSWVHGFMDQWVNRFPWTDSMGSCLSGVAAHRYTITSSNNDLKNAKHKQPNQQKHHDDTDRQNPSTGTIHVRSAHGQNDHTQIHKRYKQIKVLGVGASCQVMVCQDLNMNERKEQEMVAMKILPKAFKHSEALWKTEVDILQRLYKQKNCMELVDNFQDSKNYYIITQLYEGGELFDRIKQGSFSEKVAATLAQQMLEAIAWAHAKNVVHRDLKPENAIFADDSNTSRLVIIDWGCAAHVMPDEVTADIAGSAYYISRDILDSSVRKTGDIWKAADCWSIGVIVFLLVCGFPPFNGSNENKIFRRIMSAEFHFPSSFNGRHSLSSEVKDFISKLLEKDPTARLTAEQALQHPWLKVGVAPDSPLPDGIVESIKSFRNQCRLKKAVARVMAARFSEIDKMELKAVFDRFDDDGSGRLDIPEVLGMMRHLGKGDIEAQQLMEDLDEDGSGNLSLDELTPLLAISQLERSAAASKSMFALFDADSDGMVTYDEILRVCNFLTPSDIRKLIHDVDLDGDGRINYNEWLIAMKSLRRLPTIR